MKKSEIREMIKKEVKVNTLNEGLLELIAGQLITKLLQTKEGRDKMANNVGETMKKKAESLEQEDKEKFLAVISDFQKDIRNGKIKNYKQYNKELLGLAKKL